MKIVINIKFVAQTSNIKKISENIKSDVITSKVASLIVSGAHRKFPRGGQRGHAPPNF